MHPTASRRFSTPIRAVVAAGMIALAACGADEADRAAARATVADSAGVRIVTHPAADPAHPARRLPAEPDLRLGEPALQLTEVAGAALLEDGGVAVADGGARRIFVVAADGTVRATLGGAGKGPGEFGRLGGLMRLPGDTLVAWDPGEMRATVFAPDGRVARVVRPEPAPSPTFALLRGILPDGGLLLDRWVDFEGMLAASPGVLRQRNPLLHYAPGGALADTLAMLAGMEFSLGRDVSFTAVPYGPTNHVAVAGGRVVMSPGEPYRVEWWDPGTGRLLSVVRRAGAPRAPTREEARREAEKRVPPPPDEAERAAWRREIEALPVRAAMAPVTAMAADDRGRVWVREAAAEGEPARWAVYGSDGMIVEEWILPTGLEVLAIGGGRLVAVARDETDVPEVRVYRLDG